MNSRAQQQERASKLILDIETLRGLSIVLVLIAHLQFFLPWPDAIFRVTSKLQFGSGVDLFFVISGYVISRSLWLNVASGDRSAAILGKFWIRRFFRLWPAAALAICITIPAVAMFDRYPVVEAFGSVEAHKRAAVAALTYWANYWETQRIAAGQPMTLLAHFWSLSLEEQFYLVFPLLALTVSTRRNIGLVAFVIIVIFSFVDRSDLKSFWWWFRIDGLSWGVLIFCLQEGPMGTVARYLARRHVLGKAAFMLGLCGLLASKALIGAGALASTLEGAGAALLVWVASANGNVFQLGRSLSTGVNYLGSRSYTIYLWHPLIYACLQIIWRAAWPGIEFSPSIILGIGMVLSLVPCLLLIEFSYWRVEVPSRDLGRRLALRFGRVPATL